MTVYRNSQQYWKSTQEKKDQFFYTSFCILTTILQDYSDASILGEDRNSEWSVVASYYGLMHSCRLLLFLVFGDFPKEHKELPSFLIGTIETVQANWLKTILTASASIENRTIERSILLQWLRHSFGSNEDWSKWLKRKGLLLDSFRILRNKLNYEGLLAGHRAHPPLVTHQQVSELFIDAKKIGEDVLKEAIVDSFRIFKCFIEKNDVDDRWLSYLNWNPNDHKGITLFIDGNQVERRRIEGIEFLKRLVAYDKLLGVPEKEFIQGNILLLEEPSFSENVPLSEEVYDNISVGVFSEKARSFEKLEEALNQLRSGVIK